MRTPIRRSKGIPLAARLVLALAVVAIGAAVLYVGIGGVGSVAKAIGSTITGFV